MKYLKSVLDIMGVWDCRPSLFCSVFDTTALNIEKLIYFLLTKRDTFLTEFNKFCV